MKRIFTLIMCVALTATMFGQTAKVEDRTSVLEGDVKFLKSQIETLKGQMSAMQTQLSELADRNAEYKKQLDIRQVLSATVDSVKYGIASAVGYAMTGNVVVTLMALNTGQDCFPASYTVHPSTIMMAISMNAMRILCRWVD